MTIDNLQRLLYLSDRGKELFQKRRLSVDIVCAGDSITGWNHLGEEAISNNGFLTYPYFLQRLTSLQVFDGGIAGADSNQGISHIKEYLELFPNSRIFLIGYGTNDLGCSGSLGRISEQLMNNLDSMINEVCGKDKKPILVNVPPMNPSFLPLEIVNVSNLRRSYHNKRLEGYSKERRIALIDIYSVLNSSHFRDAIHPNEKGAEKIAKKIYETHKLLKTRIC
jgi:lysophospholipase L1-like esterase